MIASFLLLYSLVLERHIIEVGSICAMKSLFALRKDTKVSTGIRRVEWPDSLQHSCRQSLQLDRMAALANMI